MSPGCSIGKLKNHFRVRHGSIKQFSDSNLANTLLPRTVQPWIDLGNRLQSLNWNSCAAGSIRLFIPLEQASTLQLSFTLKPPIPEVN
jgi:hypothetical protein